MDGWTRCSVVVRQLLFDGFTSINEIWRQTARVNASAARVHERTELLALDAAEAYVDVTRYLRLVDIAEDNVRVHRNLFANVQARFNGGRAGEGDLEQTRERVENAVAALAGFRQSLDEARAKYRKAVGLEPINLRTPGRLGGLPHTKDESLAVALQFNPTIKAARLRMRAPQNTPSTARPAHSSRTSTWRAAHRREPTRTAMSATATTSAAKSS